jgi:sulfite dehydrogenase (quinone) subunit SoeC
VLPAFIAGALACTIWPGSGLIGALTMGGSFNTREFFHGASAQALHGLKWGFLLLTFALPVLLSVGLALNSILFLGCALVVQYLGVLAERWFFFAQANRPQNLYHPAIA